VTSTEGLAVRDMVGDGSLGIELSIAGGLSGLDRLVHATRIQKSGLALAGHFHGIEPSRIQILGMTELTYLEQLEPAACKNAVQLFFDLDLCCVVVTESAKAFERNPRVAAALASSADEVETPLLLSPSRSSHTIMALHSLLDERLAPRSRIHGVLVDVFEVGLLILGSSGVGKSEVALELVMRGHRLVADDVVDCLFRPPGMVFGAPADLLRHHLEVRGLGILNIKDLFGVTAVRERKRIDVVVQLVQDTKEAEYDRLGLEAHIYEILDVEIPELLIPVRPGRDMASILEIAARNELLKTAGHHPAREFFGRLEGALLGHESEIPAGTAAARRMQPFANVRPPPESSVGLPLGDPSRKK
jgi:HPr kinase/phosphorylase